METALLLPNVVLTMRMPSTSDSGNSRDTTSSTPKTASPPPGLPHDSELPIRMIFASRMERTSDHAALQSYCESIHGQRYVGLMMLGFSEASAAPSGRQRQLPPTVVKTLFDATGTTLSDPTLYARLSGVPERVSFETAQAIYKTMLEEIEAHRDAKARAPHKALGMPGWVFLHTYRRLKDRAN